MSSLRDQIRAADDLRTETIEVPEWGVTLAVQSMTGRTRARMMKSALDDDGNMDYESLYPEVIIATAVDPETGALLFTSEDRDWLNTKSGAALERVAQAGMKVSGMTDESEKSLGKD